MLLYTCPTCGRWQDVSLAQAFSEVTANIAKAFNQVAPEHLGYPCPAGHGLMVQVMPEQRVYVRSGVVEAMVEGIIEKHYGIADPEGRIHRDE